MIRPTDPNDTPQLLQLADNTRVFKPLEIEALREVLDDYHESNREIGHVCITYEKDGAILGFAYYAPAAMTVNSWYLWWIAVRKDQHGGGIGTQLLRHAETEIRGKGGRALFIETSSMPHYEATRQFYRRHQYEHEATLRDFYAPGDSMVVFRKVFD